MQIDDKKLNSAIEDALKSEKKNFNQAVELIVNLKEIDLKDPKNRIKTEVALPHGLGKPRKVAVFADGELETQAKKAGADIVMNSKEIEKLSKDAKGAKKISKNFDFSLAQPNMMVLVGKVLGKVLGPRGKMPKPVPPNVDVVPIIDKLRRSVKLQFRDQPIIQSAIGMEDMKKEDLFENAREVLREIEAQKCLERGFDTHLKSVYIKKTMGDPVKAL